MENANVNLEEKVGIKLSRVTKMMLKKDQRKAERAAAKAAKKAAYDALTDDEKKALKKARALKIGGIVGGSLAAAGAVAVATLKIATGQKVEETQDAGEYEEIGNEEVSTDDYPVE